MTAQTQLCLLSSVIGLASGCGSGNVAPWHGSWAVAQHGSRPWKRVPPGVVAPRCGGHSSLLLAWRGWLRLPSPSPAVVDISGHDWRGHDGPPRLRSRAALVQRSTTAPSASAAVFLHVAIFTPAKSVIQRGSDFPGHFPRPSNGHSPGAGWFPWPSSSMAMERMTYPPMATPPAGYSGYSWYS